MKSKELESLGTIIQDLASYNEMVNVLGYGSRSVDIKCEYPNIWINTSRLTQWALELIENEELKAVKDYKFKIDQIANKKYNELLMKVKTIVISEEVDKYSSVAVRKVINNPSDVKIKY